MHLSIRFDTPLHEGQLTVLNHPARFKVLACGRRWGKTKLGSLISLKRAAEGGAVWWVAPDFPRATLGWREIRKMALQIPGTTIYEGERRIELPTHGFLQVKSAHDPDALRGEGLDLVVIDEAAFIKEEAWSESLRPALADRRGAAIFISTPNGFNYFHELWERGQADGVDWASWQFPTLANPFISKEEIEIAKDEEGTPEHVALQEYDAVFIEGAGIAMFSRDFWKGVNRYSEADGHRVTNRCIARWVAWDTAAKDKDEAAYTACCVAELDQDYTLHIKEVWRGRPEFPVLPDVVTEMAYKWNRDAKLRSVIVEDASSGIQVLQVLRATAPDWLKEKLSAAKPLAARTNEPLGKEYGWNQAAVWAKRGLIKLPEPYPAVTGWLYDFEGELYGLPHSRYKDQADSFALVVNRAKHFLAERWRAMNAAA